MKWFTDARFGMFIHWGLYAEGARHEWLMGSAGIPVEEYERKYFRHFDPDLYDPEKWVSAAAAAGMKYIVLTTKHHEGFCLWDSKYTDYKATNTMAKRDLLRPFVDACHRHGIRVGFYYSLIDWHHPMYIIDGCNGPYHRRPEEERARMNVGRDQKVYDQYVRNQVKELLTGYGPVDVMWFDFSFPAKNEADRLDFTKGKGREAWESEKLWELVKGINPNIIIETVKASEDGTGIVARLYECANTSAKGILTLGKAAERVEEVNMIEENPVLVKEGAETLELEFRPYEIRTLKFTF